MSKLRVELVQRQSGRWHIEVFVNDDGPFGDGATYTTREEAQKACDEFVARLRHELAA